MNNLSIVCFIANLQGRGVHRCKNFLKSLRSQKDTDLDPEIIIVNCSNDGSFEEVDSYCKEYKVKHIFSKLKSPVWNKGIAINYGIKQSNYDFVMGTDVDYIFQDNFLNVVQKRADSNKFLLCHVYMSKPKHEGLFVDYDENDFLKIVDESYFFGRDIADGACQLTGKKWFVKNRGYNEAIFMWGGMDNEIHRVATLSGLREDWIDNETTILHQFHVDCKRGKPPNKDYLKYGRKYRNVNFKIVNRQEASKKILSRNVGKWGELEVSLVNDYTGL